MFGQRKVLLVTKKLFRQLFPRPHTGELNLNILARLQPGQNDHIFSQINHSDRFAHIQHEDLPFFAESTGLNHQLHCLGNGHKVARHSRVSNRNRAAGGDLLLKNRHHAAPAAQHIAKAHRTKGTSAILVRLVLHINLHRSFCRAHHIGGFDRLIRGNNHKALHPMPHRQIQQIFTSQDIIFHCLLWIGFHQRHMLVGSGMENYLGT